MPSSVGKVFGQLSIQDIGFCLCLGQCCTVVVQQLFKVFVVSGLELDEEDSCPPDLEAVEVVQQVPQQQQPQQQPSSSASLLTALGADSELIRNLAIAIKVRFFTFVSDLA